MPDTLRPRSNTWSWVGVVGAAYVLVYLLTSVLSSRPVRPLYDATGDIPVPYQWVRPPTDLSVDNVPATAKHAQVDPSRGGTVSTPDAQVVLTIPPSTLAAGGSGDAVSVDIEALAPATLAPVGGGRDPDGNAYLVRFSAVPAGTALTTTARPFDIALREPQFDLIHDVVLTSPGPKGPWRQLAAVQSGPDAMLASATNTGYFVLAGKVMTAQVTWHKVAEVAGAALGVLVLVVVAIRRGRRSLRQAPIR